MKHLFWPLLLVFAFGCSDPDTAPPPVDVPCGGACPADECILNMCTGGNPDAGPDDIEEDDVPNIPDTGEEDVEEDVPAPEDVPDAPEDIIEDVDQDVDDGGEDVEEDAVEDVPDPEDVPDVEDEQPDCTADADCGDGEICEAEACVEGCREDAGCPDTDFCDTDTLSCTQGCRIGGCPDGQVCELDTRECVQGSDCVNDQACPQGQICEGEACVDGCRLDRQCEDNQICQDNACIGGCREDEACGEDEICLNNTCGPGCRADLDCVFPQTCLEGNQCGGRACEGDLDCVLGSVCVNGTCGQGCRNDVECGDDAICNQANACTAGCRTDGDCEDNLFCSPDNQCVNGCRDDNDCGPDAICDTPRDIVCLPGCRTDDACPDTQFCNIPPLSTFGSCQEGCRLRECPGDQVCNTQIRLCGPSEDPCDDDNDCGDAQICGPSGCVEGCRANSDCLDEQVCDEAGNFCRIGCRDDEGCATGQYCDEGIDQCLGGCRGDEDCGFGQSCVDDEVAGRICIPSPCLEDTDCPDDLFCDGDSDTCQLGCRFDACPGDLACEPNIRVCLEVPCEANEECRLGDVCVEGRCEAGCSGDEACDGDQYCNIPRGDDFGVCTPGCRPDSCDEGQRCDTLQRFCVEPVCTNDTDCDEGQYCRDQAVCDFGCRNDGECGDAQICDEVLRACIDGCRDENDGDDVCSVARANPVDVPLQNSLIVEGRLCRGDVDHISFNLEANEQAIITVIAGNGVGDVIAEAIGPDCQTIVATGGFEGDPNRLNISADTAGTYTLRLSTDANFSTNSYAVAIQRTPRACPIDPEEPNEIGDGLTPRIDAPRGRPVSVNGRAVCIGDEDWYAVQVDAPGDILRVALSQNPGDAPLRIELRDQDDIFTLDANEDDTPTKTVQTAPFDVATPVFIRVSATGDVPVTGISYGLSVFVGNPLECQEDDLEPNDTPPTASPIDAGATEVNLCQSREDQEWFVMEFFGGETVNLTLAYDHDAIAPAQQLATTLFGPGGPDDIRDFTLRDGDVDRLGLSPDGFTVSNEDAGLWLLSIESGNGAPSLDITVDVDIEAPFCEEEVEEVPNESCLQAIGLALLEDANGFICGPSLDEDWYRIEPEVGTNLAISLEHFHFEGNLDLEAYAADGTTLLDFSYNAGPDLESISLPLVDGDICIRVFTQSRQVANNYTLFVEAN